MAKGAAAAKRGLPDLPKKVDASRETPAPTKVIVYNDDDDETPVQSAETHAPSRPAAKAPSRITSSRKTADLDAREARPTASGDRSLIRALGLKIGKIVIDPGHGGHDTGTMGPMAWKKKIWSWKSDGVWARCWRRDWERKSSIQEKTTRSFRWKHGPRLRTSRGPTCSSPSTRTRATIRGRVVSRLTT